MQAVSTKDNEKGVFSFPASFWALYRGSRCIFDVRHGRKKRGENAITHHEPVKVLLGKKKLQKSGGKAGMREELQEKGGCLLPYDNPENRRIDLDYLVIK